MLGIKETDYLPAKMTIQVTHIRTTRFLGMAFIKITMVGTKRTSRQQVYIMEASDQLYLSQQGTPRPGLPARELPRVD